ncbi:hypothetical protein SAMN06264364_12370 [Quadrisphaera granulorum]|uniref:Uncharacterized protein n=1 Tax=Quadrisphaera granulorum TaxID=317664 RepID=A0A315ZZG1_9ACTN|nr:hypothetical protein BXY45_12370 [Quadrisphaera granulorum]SZE98026.1 hypothetical protein SAMN06264364_12370 [Quadrisphaera granulorum]
MLVVISGLPGVGTTTSGPVSPVTVLATHP